MRYFFTGCGWLRDRDMYRMGDVDVHCVTHAVMVYNEDTVYDMQAVNKQTKNSQR
jgi:hypothetical protein